MNTWMVIAGIWAMFAICVVLFVRGAASRVERTDEPRDDSPATSADTQPGVKA